VILLDLYLPDSREARVVEELTRSDQQPIVLMMSAFEDLTGVESYVAAGASGFISKTAPAEALSMRYASPVMEQPFSTDRRFPKTHVDMY
jgi:DNA-binding NarL/FixJ family response regulator